MRAWIIAGVVLAITALIAFALFESGSVRREPERIESVSSVATPEASLPAVPDRSETSRDERADPLEVTMRTLAIAAPNEAPITEQLEIVGRAFDENRQPLVRTTLWCRVESLPVSLNESDVDVAVEDGSTVRSDGDGRFRYTTPSLVRSTFAPWFVLRARPKVSSEISAPQSRTLVMPILKHEPRIDLGDVVLALDPILAAGRIVLEDGSPASNVRVRVELPDGDGWRRDPWHLALSDATGSFTIRGRGRSGDRLLVRGFRPTDLWVEPYVGPPRQDLVLTAKSGGSATITGRVQLDPGIDASGLCFRWSSEVSASGFFETTIDARDSSFVLNGLDVGPTNFGVYLKHSRAQIAELRGVWARLGKSKIDPRLDPLDLRGTIHSIRATLVAEDGNPAANARVNLYDDRTGLLAFEVVSDANGKLDFLVPRAITVLRLEKLGATNVEVFDGATVKLVPE